MPLKVSSTRTIVFLLVVVFLGFMLFFTLRLNPAVQRTYLVNFGTSSSPINSEAGSGGVAMDDPAMISLLREKYLLPPPPSDVSLNLSSVWLKDTSMGQAARVRKILGNMRNGFFIECGALDGETRSNTLVFERLYNWSGLLIEADPLNYREAVYKRRRVFLSQSCLSIKPYPVVVSFHQARNLGKIEEWPVGNQQPNHVEVQCFPLFSYLMAINRTTVDYFSLDVEGNELEVLETIPWDKVNIRTLSVEFIHGTRGKGVMRSFMESKGYYVHSEVTHMNNLANDFIFVKTSENKT